MAHDEQATWRRAGRRRRPGDFPQQRQLTEEVGGPEVGQVLAVAIDADGAVDDHEELGSAGALAGHDTVRGQIDLVGEARDLLQTATIERGEERHL